MKTLNIRRKIILALSFHEKMIFLEGPLYQLYSISLPAIKGVFCLNQIIPTLSKTISVPSMPYNFFAPFAVWSCFPGHSALYKRRFERLFLLANLLLINFM